MHSDEAGRMSKQRHDDIPDVYASHELPQRSKRYTLAKAAMVSGVAVAAVAGIAVYRYREEYELESPSHNINSQELNPYSTNYTNTVTSSQPPSEEWKRFLEEDSMYKDKVRHMKRKKYLRTTLAAIAVVSALDTVGTAAMRGKERREIRHTMGKEELTPRQELLVRRKAKLQDLASIGTAAICVRSTIAEVKESKRLQEEYREFQEFHAGKLRDFREAKSHKTDHEIY